MNTQQVHNSIFTLDEIELPCQESCFFDRLTCDLPIFFIQSSSFSDESDTPFFMVMSYTNPHAPIEPMEEYVERNDHIDFYQFQQHERKREQYAKLREDFERDKARIAKMRQDRKFRPV